jgi:DNA-binding HxlR family transcriptional regulator
MLKHRKSRVGAPPEECPLTRCLQFLKGSWTPHVLWYLRETPRRFNELKGDLGNVSSKVLAERLKRLERDSLVRRRIVMSSPPSVEYSLTDLGHKLIPTLEALVAIGYEVKQRSYHSASDRLHSL